MTVRLAIVGAGPNATGHARALLRSSDARVSAVHDVDTARAETLAGTCGARVARSVEEAVDGCDAVYVCTWTAAHLEVVDVAAAAGRAIFCEKPLAPDLARARALVESVDAAGVTNQVGLPLRWRPEFAVLRHLLADPANGLTLSATLHSEIPNRSRTLASWRGDRAVAGGGMLLEVGFHDLDVLGWLVGPVSSLAAFATPAGGHDRVEDAAALSLAFGTGAVGSLVAVWHDAPHRTQTRRLLIVCEHAHYQLELGGGVRQLTVAGPGDRQQTMDGTDLDRAAVELGLPTDPDGAFVRAVERGEPAAPGVAEALAVHELIDTAYRSAAGAATGTVAL